MADDEDDYNPFDHRVIDKPNSWVKSTWILIMSNLMIKLSYSTMGSLAHLLKSFLGTGVLAMAAAIGNAGNLTHDNN